jgi:hypothetical protein
MLFPILSVGEAPQVERVELLDKTTVQGLSASQGLSAVLHWYLLSDDFLNVVTSQ